MAPAAKPGTIVVGLGGSHASRAALHWAVGEAARRAFSLTVVTVLTTEHDDWAQINRMQAHLIREAAATVPTRLAIHRKWVAGQIAPALVSASEDCSMLVLGGHQPRVSRDTAVGFITEQCLLTARCPIVVVPAATGRGTPGDQPTTVATQGQEPGQ